jgi:hypothetical protein
VGRGWLAAGYCGVNRKQARQGSSILWPPTARQGCSDLWPPIASSLLLALATRFLWPANRKNTKIEMATRRALGMSNGRSSRVAMRHHRVLLCLCLSLYLPLSRSPLLAFPSLFHPRFLPLRPTLSGFPITCICFPSPLDFIWSGGVLGVGSCLFPLVCEKFRLFLNQPNFGCSIGRTGGN